MPVANLCWLPLEFHLGTIVRSGYVRCPTGFRLLDLLNYAGEAHPNAMRDFIEYVDFSDIGSEIPSPDVPCEFVRKNTIDLVAVTKENMGRGVGGMGQKSFPYRQKMPVIVRIALPHHSLIGVVHSPEGHGIRHILGLPQTFFPVTDVTIYQDDGRYESRPFVAVNKEHISSLREEPVNRGQGE